MAYCTNLDAMDDRHTELGTASRGAKVHGKTIRRILDSAWINTTERDYDRGVCAIEVFNGSVGAILASSREDYECTPRDWATIVRWFAARGIRG